MWHCVEERSKEVTDFGRFQRKVLFEEIYADRQSIIANNPLSAKTQTQLQVNFLSKFLARKSGRFWMEISINLFPYYNYIMYFQYPSKK